MLSEAHPVTIEELPETLAAFAAVQQLPVSDGGLRDRTDRRGRLRYDKVWVRARGPAPAVAETACMAEHDLRWLATAATLRRGRRAEALADAASSSGLFRLLYELDLSQARTRLGRLAGITPRPDAQPVLDRWLAGLTAQGEALMLQLIDAVPGEAKRWAAEEAPRLIAGAADSASRRARLVQDLCALARNLPADGVPLSVLADAAVHSTHGLDPGTNLGRLGARMAAVIAGLDPPAGAAAVRQAWEAVGVWVDRVSSQIAGWNLPLHHAHPAAAAAAAYREAGEPAVLTLGILSSARAQLIAPPPPGGTLWVIEGISVLSAAAARQVPASVICRGGTPSVAVTRTIRAAVEAGWIIAVSSDFEPRGLHGAITLLRQVQAAGRPWRLAAADYLAGPAEGEPFRPDQVPDTPWDPALADAMRQRCERVSEEARLADLIADMQRQVINDERQEPS
jgi:uncharacterized protein (TIGR02679 family)